MGVPLQTYRLRIGTFRYNCTSGSIKRIKNQPCNGTLNKFLLLLALLTLSQSVLIWYSPGKLASVHFPSLTNPPWNSASPPESPPQDLSQPRSLSQRVLTWCPPPSTSPPWPSSSSRIRNFYARMVNGNGRQRGIKIIHWNRGSSYLENKFNKVEAVINGHKPHMIGLSEANLRAGHNKTKVQLTDYNLHTAQTLDNPDLLVSRVVVYTHNLL